MGLLGIVTNDFLLITLLIDEHNLCSYLLLLMNIMLTTNDHIDYQSIVANDHHIDY